MISFLGKVLIVAALCFQAWLLHSNTVISTEFHAKLTIALKSCDCIPADISTHILAHGKHILMGLLGSSVLMLVSRCWVFKIFVILGLAAQLYLEHMPFKNFPHINNLQFWTQVALIGGIIFLMGRECASGACAKPVKG